jgi:hypothetical protein
MDLVSGIAAGTPAIDATTETCGPDRHSHSGRATPGHTFFASTTGRAVSPRSMGGSSSSCRCQNKRDTSIG